MTYLRENLAESITLARIQRAKELLSKGVRASEVAPRVGLYNQSQQDGAYGRKFELAGAGVDARQLPDHRVVAEIPHRRARR